ncbi:MAG: hypothetical protein NT004_14675 [Bacteroidetes bacterium]|nr:hypothetical protein [Bacteroidota bacterium]
MNLTSADLMAIHLISNNNVNHKEARRKSQRRERGDAGYKSLCATS